MAEIKFTIPDDKVQNFIKMVSERHPCPKNPDTGEPTFTPSQWAKEYFRRLFIREYRAWAGEAADHAVQEDAELVS